MSRFRQQAGNQGAFGGAQVDNVAGHVHPRIIEQARQTGKLNISNRGLTTIPDTVWNMHDPSASQEQSQVDLSKSTNNNWWDVVDLETINAADNELESVDEKIGNFITLVHLDLHNNRIQLLPASIGQLKNLTYINLANNKLRELPAEVYSLPLVNLDLQNNELEMLDNDYLGKLQSLQVLNISHNRFQALPEAIGKLYKLTHLQANNNQLKTPLPYSLTNANSLRVLNVSVNQLTAAFDVSNGQPLQFARLQHLDLRRNRLTSLTRPDAAAPIELPELQELFLSANRLYHIDDILITTHKLLTLDIHQNLFSEWPAGIFKLSVLNRLDISSNEFINLPPHLGLLETLKSFLFDGNPIRVLPRASGAQAILERLRDRISEGEENSPPVIAPREPASLPTPSAHQSTAGNEVETIVEATTRVTIVDDNPTPVTNQKATESTPTPPVAVKEEAAVPVVTKPVIPSGPPNVEIDISPPDMVSHTLKLIRLQLSDDDPARAPILPPLPFEPVSLVLNYNLFTSFPALASQFASTLTSLSLTHNRLTKFPSDASLAPMYNLRQLDLSRNQITQFPDAAAASRVFPQVTILNLSHNRLTGRTPNSLLVPRLQTLQLRGNHLTELDVQGCYGLHALDLADNDLQSLPFELGRCETIKHLSIEGNALRLPRRDVIQRGTDEIMQWLRDRLPN
ncbi:hypothetical protein BDF19DRAFT_422736 [Syncephalis fuscata]|nr:hypothetical protein BDF19DRAFT_422736 [Syncephalis fuscata]